MLSPKVFKARNLAKSEEKNVADKNVYLDYCPVQSIFLYNNAFYKNKLFLNQALRSTDSIGKI